ncbi:hypothetical protein MH1LPH_23900 [Lactiplantibacillus brownii]
MSHRIKNQFNNNMIQNISDYLTLLANNFRVNQQLSVSYYVNLESLHVTIVITEGFTK